MIKTFQNEWISFSADPAAGTVTDLRCREDSRINWLIDGETANRYGYGDAAAKLLGKSVLRTAGQNWETENMAPAGVEEGENKICFRYLLGKLELRHTFEIAEGSFRWMIELENHGSAPARIDQMYHWMPVQYVMHETREENLHCSCSFVPSVSEDCSYALCRRRDGSGPDMVAANMGGGLRSFGSLCRYKNLFFEKEAPSLSGMVLMCAVNCFCEEVPQTVDWMYGDLRKPVVIGSGEVFRDDYSFFFTRRGELEKDLLQHELPVFRYEPAVICGRECSVSLKSSSPAVSYRLLTADRSGVHEEDAGTAERAEDGFTVSLKPFRIPGERKLCVTFENGKTASVIFAVYSSMREIVESVCGKISRELFIDDPEDPNYCGYRPISRQGESCAKGSLLLLKNLLSVPNPEEIRQVERNAALYLRKRWLNDDFTAIKQYPGGFARIIDMDYLLLEFYLLSQVDDRYLALNSADTYLDWAFRTAEYRLSVTPDKLPREAVEVELASMISWLQAEMPDQLRQRGRQEQADRLETLWKEHVCLQQRKARDGSFVETEHYFDNAGFSVVTETLLNSGCFEEASQTVRLLLANVAPGTDYRCYAPDRWWEALAPMYHNLWAVLSAKPLLTAYEKLGGTEYLEAAYRAMIPMFYNYDWNAVSARNQFEKGAGVSAYCLTSPNLNVQEASHNRFGQSIFKDDFFSQMDLAGDDWDLGMDMVVYLYTFGRKCYLVEKDGRLEAVNATVEDRDGAVAVKSNAAYPREYRLDAFGLTVSAQGNACIGEVVLTDGACSRIMMQGSREQGSVSVLKNGTAISGYEICWTED